MSAHSRNAARPALSPQQRARRIVLLLVASALVLPIAAFAVFYWSAEIPSPQQMRASQVTTLLASDATTVISTIAPEEGNRTIVALSDVPPQARTAVLAAEDRDFYRNPGFSVTGFLRAALDNLRGDPQAGGGSTITQQYVKNAFLSPERSVLRKMRELVIATKMARQWSKDDILAAYLNTLYFGRGAYGIADAADAYFAKPLGRLTLAEDAVLAAVIRAPSRLSQPEDLPKLQARWNYVLDGMVSMKQLAPAERAAVRFPAIAPAHPSATAAATSGPEGLIGAQVLRELSAAGIPDKAVGGLQITTTIDAKAQRAAVDSVDGALRNQPAQLRAAAVSVDPRTGAVRAYYGGNNGVGFDFANAPLQTGSAFKVFGLVAALQQGMSLSTQFSSAPLTVRGTTIGNVDGESCGTCGLGQALKQSLNTSFYRMTLSMYNGPQAIADAAHRAGIPETIPGVPGISLTENGGPPLAGIVLGQYLVRPIDMASGYATLAASGVYRTPYFVQKVVDATGAVLVDRSQPADGEDRIPKYVADSVTTAMLPIAAYSRNHSLADKRASAAKTGTTQLGNTGLNKDAWMVGYTPSLSTAVWVGGDRSQAIKTRGGSSIYGSGLPADIWMRTMNGALAGTPIEKFETTARVDAGQQDPIIGQPGLIPNNQADQLIRPGPARLDQGPWPDQLFRPGPATPQGREPDPLFGPGPPIAGPGRAGDPLIGPGPAVPPGPFIGPAPAPQGPIIGPAPAPR